MAMEIMPVMQYLVQNLARGPPPCRLQVSSSGGRPGMPFPGIAPGRKDALYLAVCARCFLGGQIPTDKKLISRSLVGVTS